MRFTEVGSFLEYFERVRGRTRQALAAVPPDRMDWTYKPGKFTPADIARHLAAIERWMYAENVSGRPSRYAGHGPEIAAGYPDLAAFVETMHREAMDIFGALSPEDLERKCITPAGAPIATWKWLRSMIEHEIHHRGQIYVYLSLLGREGPPLYGLTSEEVRARSVPPSS